MFEHSLVISMSLGRLLPPAHPCHRPLPRLYGAVRHVTTVLSLASFLYCHFLPRDDKHNADCRVARSPSVFCDTPVLCRNG